MTRVFLIAGEASGDALGAALMVGLKQLEPQIAFSGVAGPQMLAEGMTSLFPMEELSVMGLAEVLPRYRHLKRRIAETARAVLDEKPDVMVTIDSPDFSLRVAKIVKTADPSIRTVHYVAPSVWAWRAGRAKKMAAMIDQVLALLPFEPPYMEAEGMRCDFVGHPIVAQEQPSDQQVTELRDELGIPDYAKVLAILPGSRSGEVKRLMPVFRQVVKRLSDEIPDLEFVLPAAPGVVAMVANTLQDWPVQVHMLDPRDRSSAEVEHRKRCLFRLADTALAASGTVSLELAAAETPMVIAYDMNWLTRQIIWRMVRIDTVTLVNLVSETRVVPEFLGTDCRADLIAPALSHTLSAPAEQLEAARLTMERLGAGQESPGLRAARAVLDGLGSAHNQ
ncbi:lipid-A-disaccharide synthase [Qingshengfaniella alkalisoli]|uniref:Lipid-A-disaccharide synthase n=1 Tax=Qingshengfaniella alkalisoli TaxID=2599296 RepID=A0A5B8J488_9RHOB|nr:lipid-A-disaccharide synthase [Qingshengfaniella alkalisoli]QDY69327.1 lipid-A-disaccharide synthase [Qingshengfaniella alkalisoli]